MEQSPAGGRPTTRAFCLAACLALATAASSEAADDRYGPFRLGPFRLRPKLALARYGGIAAPSTPNSGDFSPEDPAPDPSADSSTTLTPSLGVTLPVGRRLRFTGGGAAFLSPTHSQEDAFFKGFGVSGGSAFDFGPISLFGSISTGRAEERVSFELDQRATRHDDGLGAGAALRLGRRITLQAARADRNTTYEKGIVVEGADVSDTLNRESGRTSYAIQCALTRLTTLTLSADILDDHFQADDTTIRSYRYVGGFDFSPLAFIRGRIRVGKRELPEGQGITGYSGPTLFVGANVPFFDFGTLTGSAERDITYSARRTAAGERSVYVLNRYRGDFRFGLPLSLVATTYYSTEHAQFLDEGQDATAQLTRVHRYGVTLLRAFGASFRAGGTVEAVEQVGSDRSRRLRYLVTAEWTP